MLEIYRGSIDTSTLETITNLGIAIAKVQKFQRPVIFGKENCEYPQPQPNQLIPEVKFKLQEPKIIITSLSNHKDHEPAALVNDQSTKSEEEKLQITFGKMSEKLNIDKDDKKIAIKVTNQ
uniref:Uncharacterized protein n=1 Tax=Romanomermis culicivorax TaxID=13658 RepID=A0A915KLH6_ROMCU